ncbi:MAG: tetratricopeptide repeat protein [Anaerolineae bacterium]|nr:tetratricopeptide repeat protein [Anaerolineae bacterium]
MPGNQEKFERSMLAGDDAAWNQQWDKAIEAYMTAVREFPNNVHACNSLGYALYSVGRLEDALKVYMQASKIDETLPLPVERMADVLERLGRLNDAAKQYLAVADIYLAQHDLEKAISNWEKATQITPGLVKIHQRLAMAYERTGQKDSAISEYLNLAYNFQKAGNNQVALQALERALRIDSRDARVLNAKTAVINNVSLSPDLAREKSKKASDNVKEEDLSFINYDAADADARGPIGDAVERALEMLATHVFETGMMDMAGASAIQAIEMHRAGINQEAIGAYQRAEAAGMSYTGPLFMNLGALLVEVKRWQDSLGYLQKVSGDALLTAGAMHGLGLAYMGLRDYRHAVKSFINTLRLVDMALALSDEEKGELSNVYSRIASMASQATEGTLEALGKKFESLLTGKDWKRRVALTRSQIEDFINNDVDRLLENLAQDDGVIESMGRVDEYVRQKRYTLAMDEVHQILMKSPDYLAAHLRVAQVLMDIGHVEQAIQKYNLIAQTYLVRGDMLKTADILNEVIRVAPADIRLRENLIELLEQQGRHEEMLDQYIDLADTYVEMADVSNARTTYNQALKLAQRLNASPQKVASILTSTAKLDENRLELRGALRIYQQISEMLPEDEQARRKLVDLNFRLNNPINGTQELDNLLRIYAKQRRADLILKTLEDLAERYPKDMAIRSRLGSVYEQMKRSQDAIVQFEHLRQLQHDAGMLAEAKKTIERIIKLQPPNGAHYRAMLQQMGG